MKRLMSKITNRGGTKRSTSLLVADEDFMMPNDIAKLKRRSEIVKSLNRIPLKPAFETFDSITHEYIENGIGTLNRVVSTLIDVDWLERNTEYRTIEAANLYMRYQIALDRWLLNRLEKGQWDDFRSHDEIPSPLYVIIVERVNLIWERFVIDNLLKLEQTIYRRVLTYELNTSVVGYDIVDGNRSSIMSDYFDGDFRIGTPIKSRKCHEELETMIIHILEDYIITRNDEVQNLRQAMEHKFGIDGFGGFIRRAKKEVCRHAHRHFIKEFRASPPLQTLEIFKNIYKAMMGDHVSELSKSMNVHPTLIERALQDMPLPNPKNLSSRNN
ncbi:hypothetical protein BDC45DRAFT_530720 [Circinella umbellata]|nr:hypothetical protein BDC45DRAFT_530720 [Circinella umbellata]